MAQSYDRSRRLTGTALKIGAVLLVSLFIVIGSVPFSIARDSAFAADSPSDPSPFIESPLLGNFSRWAIGLNDPDALVARLFDNGVLVVSGTGDAVSFASAKEVPWLQDGQAKHIKEVVFCDTVEPQSIAYWFTGCTRLKAVSTLPASLKNMEGTFAGCIRLEAAPVLPSHLKTLDAAFKGCTSLAVIPDIMASSASMSQTFYDCPKIITIPQNFIFGSKSESCFGLSGQLEALLPTTYDGCAEGILSYNWAADGRALTTSAPLPEEPASLSEGETPEKPAVPDVGETPKEPTVPDGLCRWC